jgi:hypothetical protein
MSKISIPGAIIGAVVDVVSSVVLGLPIGIYALSKVDLAHTPEDQVYAAIIAATRGNAVIYWSQLAIGLACSILGGWVAARIAKRAEPLNGVLSSFLCVALGILILRTGASSESAGAQILLLAASPAMGLLGGCLRFLQVRSKLPQSA